MPTRVDLWHVRTDQLDAEATAACARLLTDEEKTKHARFVFERHRHEYLVTRGLVRAVLAPYVGAAPRDLSFFRTEHGRPLLERAGAVRFNLTNTVELVACGVTLGSEIGVDAEPLSRADQILEIAHAVFTDHERADLARLEGAARERRAVELWTLKEAYIKARGLGLSLEVQKIEVWFDALATPSLRFFPPVVDTEGRWKLTTVEIDGHLISTCVDASRSSPDVEVNLRRADLATLLR